MNRPLKASTHLLIINVGLLIFLFLLSFYSEINKGGRKIDLEYRELFNNPLKNLQLKNVDSLVINNRMGQFQFKKEQNSINMIYPRHLPANMKLIREIFNQLSLLKVKKIYPLTDLNISNFSLKNPLFSLRWETAEKKNYEVKLGLINPIDHSIYFMLEGDEKIYQVESPQMHPDGLDLMRFVNSHLFSLRPAQITKLEIINLKNRKNHQSFRFEKRGDLYFSQSEKTIKNEKLQEILESLFATKAFFIIDNIEDHLQKILSPYQNDNSYAVHITNENGRQLDYTFSSTINEAIAELKIDRGQYIYATASNRPHPYIISSEILTLLKNLEQEIGY